MKQTSKSSFAPDWLALREPADHAARDGGLLSAAAESLSPGKVVLDLGCGTGSTVRAFAGAGFAGLHWRMCDNDPVLLDVAQARHPEAEIVLADLGQLDRLPLDGVGLVTCSALLDLMSLEWVETLADHLSHRKIPFYAALSYDGVMEWNPVDPDDGVVTTAFNRHQQTDKGLGLALGPRASRATAAVFSAKGYAAQLANSPWEIDPEQALLHDMLLNGIVDAAKETGVQAAQKWAERRRATLHESHVTIGHIDVLMTPPDTRTAEGTDNAGN